MTDPYQHLQQALIEAITQAQDLFVHYEDNQAVFDQLLTNLLNLTGSEYGFIGEVLKNDKNEPYLKTHAITNIAWNDETRQFYDENAPSGLEFYNLNSLFGAVLTTKQAVISNSPATDERRCGIPEGHPPLNAFLGAPILVADQLIAMVGVSNRDGGYEQGIIDFLQPLLATIGQLIRARKNEVIRLQAEQKLIERDQLFNKLSQQVPGMIYQFLLRPDGSSFFSFCSDGIQDTYNLTPQDIINDSQPMFDRIHPDDIERINNEIMQSAEKLKNLHVEFRIMHPVKGVRWLEGWASPEKAKDGGTLWHGFMTDISKRIESQSEYKRMALVARKTDNAVIITDAKGLIEWVNDSFTNMTGYTLDEVINKKPGDFLQGKETDPEVIKYMSQQLAQGKGFEVDIINYHKNGTPYWVTNEVQPVHDHSGKITNFIAIERDITERRRIEIMKDEFISTLSHELRTPLTSISGSLSLLAGGAMGELPEQAKSIVDVATRNSHQLTLLINDLLDMEKIAAGKMQFDIQKHSLINLIHQALNANQGYAEKYGVSFNLTTNFDDLSVNVDDARFMQVLANLLSNAAKYSPKNDVITVHATSLDHSVRIEVIDHGPGIPEEFHEHIFNKFSQADSTDTREREGTGLGLAITKELIEKMQGKIGFHSIKEKGATFYIELPIT